LLGALLLAIAFGPQLVPSDETTGETQAKGSVNQTQVPAKPVDLGQTEWLLERFGPSGEETEPLPGSITTLWFENGKLSGTAACNHYFGGYQAIGDLLTVGMLGSTERWCEGLMDQERAYLTLLGEVATAKRQGELVILTAPEGRLVFSQQSLIRDNQLMEVVWELKTLITGDASQLARSEAGLP
jgi:heat shock protein HslJ